MSDLSYIPDGYTMHGYIDGARGLYASCRLTYRPCTVQQRAFVMGQVINERNPQRAELIAAQFMARQILTWDVCKPSDNGAPGEPVGLEPGDIGHLQPTLFHEIYQMLLGGRASDIDPDEKLDMDDHTLAEEMEAGLTGTTLAGVRSKN